MRLQFSYVDTDFGIYRSEKQVILFTVAQIVVGFHSECPYPCAAKQTAELVTLELGALVQFHTVRKPNVGIDLNI